MSMPFDSGNWTPCSARCLWVKKGAYRAERRGRYMLWVSQSEGTLQVRVMVCARTQGAGHQGIRTTVRCGTFCAWAGMENVVVEFVGQCLYCVDPEAGNMVHRPLGEVIHGMEVGEVLHFNNLRLGASDVLLI